LSDPNQQPGGTAVQPPRIELIPARPAVCRDATTTLDVLVRITPPLPEVHILRPPINMAIVLDRSGSMSSGRKMEHARDAAIFAIGQLLPTDRISVTVFDEQIETIAPSAPATDKPGLAARIRRIGPRGSTALHGGWEAGARQVLEHLVWQGMNRVLLLSDGLANVGLTDPGSIAAEVRGMAGREVSTSTIGVGRDYSEALLSAMADAGAGSYYYVDNPVQLPDIFQTELQGLMATTGRNVELSIKPGSGVAVAEVLTGLERGPDGQIKVPDMVSDMPISVLVRLSVPPAPSGGDLGRVTLAWDPTGETAGRRQECSVGLALPGVTLREWEQMPLDPAVQEQLILLMAARARDELHGTLARGDVAGSRAILDQIHALIATVPETFELREELKNLEETQAMMNTGDMISSAKKAQLMAWYRKKGRSSPPPKQP
jgi:Ca-activated chloride channel family protein